MELKLKFNDKERHILYRVLAVVLFIHLFAMCVLSLAYLESEYGLKGRSYLLAGFILAIPMWISTVAVFKHYR